MTFEDLRLRIIPLFKYFQSKDYFGEKLGITESHIPENALNKAEFILKFRPFPVDAWMARDDTEDSVFDFLEFLYDHVSKPGKLIEMTENGYNYVGYDGYDEFQGKDEFRDATNSLLMDYKQGFELNEAGHILARGSHGLEYILNAELVPYDEINVDNKVRNAILKWRNRGLDTNERKQAILQLIDVFEWLKKTGKLELALSKRDDTVLFEIANNFNLRHHNPKQKREYDEEIWYSWMFHFYLATYHAVIRFLKKSEKGSSE